MRGPDGKVVHADYVLTDGTVDVGGQVVAQDARKGIVLRRIFGPLRQVSRVDGLYPQDTWSGREVTYTRLGCRGGSVAVTLQSDPGLFTKPTTVVASVDGRRVARASVAPTATEYADRPARPARRVVRGRASRFRRPPSRKVVTNGQNPDPRELGVHFTRFTYKPS